jgi:DNA-binding MarR family transcriptional regulator
MLDSATTTRTAIGTSTRTLAGQDDLGAIERAMSTLVRWGNLPRIREHYVAAAGMALDRASYGILVRLQESGPLRLSDLAERLGVDLSTASRQVHHLQVAGLVERATIEEDRRASLLTVTDPGKEMVDRILEARRSVITQMLEGWSPEERAELGRVLTRLADQIVSFGCRER